MKMTFRHIFLGTLLLIITSVSLVIFGTKLLVKEYDEVSRNRFVEQLQSALEAGPLALARLHASDIAQQHLDRLVKDLNGKFDLINSVRIFTLGDSQFEYARYVKSKYDSKCNKEFLKTYQFAEALSEFAVSVQIDTCKPASDATSIVDQVQKTLITISAFLFLSFMILFSPILTSLRNGSAILRSSLPMRMSDIEKTVLFAPVREMLFLAIRAKDLERDVLKMEITRQVAHDIRSPLTALNVLATDLQGISQKHRNMISNIIQRINEVSNNLLSGTIPNSHNNSEGLPVDISDLVKDSVTEKRMEFKNSSRHVSIHLLVDETADYTSFLNLSDFKRVLSNLMNNAIESFDKDLGRVDVILKKTADAIHLSIQDNGKGMPKEILDVLGTESISYDKNNTSAGFGLGVKNAFEVIGKIKGHITYQSTEGVGTTVDIYLPPLL